MNRQQAKEILPIIEAYAAGKTIQVKSIIDGLWHDYDNKDGISLNSAESQRYRIKPESKYRPFIDNKECWNEMLKHQPFGWVRTMNAENDYYIIDGVLYSENLDCPVVTMAGESYDYKEMLDIYLFADGTPFGIKI